MLTLRLSKQFNRRSFCLYVSVTESLGLFYLQSVISALIHLALNAHVIPVGAEIVLCWVSFY